MAMWATNMECQCCPKARGRITVLCSCQPAEEKSKEKEAKVTTRFLVGPHWPMVLITYSVIVGLSVTIYIFVLTG